MLISVHIGPFGPAVPQMVAICHNFECVQHLTQHMSCFLYKASLEPVQRVCGIYVLYDGVATDMPAFPAGSTATVLTWQQRWSLR